MATRFYFASSGTPAVTAPFLAWDSSAQTTYLPLVTTTGGTAIGTFHYFDTSNTDQNHLMFQFISSAVAAQTFASQTLSFQMQADEVAAGNNMVFAIGAKLVDSTGAVVGTFFDITRDATEITAGAVTNRSFSATSGALTSNAGDRVVVEIGIGGDPTGGGDHEAFIRLGDSGTGGDLPVDDTDTTASINPWFQFANTINFSSSQDSTATPSTASLSISVFDATASTADNDFTRDPNCKGAYLMTSDGNETDLSGNNGTLIASTPNLIGTSTDSPYSSGFSRQFTKADTEFLFQNDNGPLDIFGASQDISWTLWFKVSTITDQDTMFSKYGAAGARQYLCNINSSVAGTFNVQALTRKSSDAGNNIENGGSFGTGVWVHFGAVFQSSSPLLSFYLNGSLVSTDTTVDGSIFESTEEFRVGSRSNDLSFFDGKIGELGIFDDALTDSEISQIYNRGLRGDKAFSSVTVTATPSTVSASVEVFTATASAQKNSVASASLISVSAEVQTATATAFKSSTATPSLIEASVLVQTATALTARSSIALPDTVSSSVIVQTAVASTAIVTTALPSLVSASVEVFTASGSKTLSAVATPSVESASVLVQTATASTSTIKSSVATPSLVSASVLVNTHTAITNTGTIAQPNLISASVLLNASTGSVHNSSIATPDLISASLLINTHSASTNAGATAQPSLASASIQINTSTAFTTVNSTAVPGEVLVTVTLFTANAKITRSAIASPDQESVTIVIRTATASVGVQVTLPDISIVMFGQSAFEKQLTQPSRINNYLDEDSQIENYINAESTLINE